MNRTLWGITKDFYKKSRPGDRSYEDLHPWRSHTGAKIIRGDGDATLLSRRGYEIGWR
jgi:hypothetical protein